MKHTRDDVLRRYLPADDDAGQPPEATSRIVNAFVHKCRCNHLRDDLYQACYLVTLQVVNRAIETENPSGYIATAMRHAMIDVLDAEDTIPYPRYAAQVKKLPRPVRLYDNHQGEEWITVAPDRPHLNGQLKELAEGLSEQDAELLNMLAAGRTVQEIAKQKKCRATTVYGRRRRLRIHLRATLDTQPKGLLKLAIEVLSAVLTPDPVSIKAFDSKRFFSQSSAPHGKMEA